MRKKNKGLKILGIISGIILILGIVILIFYATGVFQRSLASDIDFIEIKLLSESDDSATYELYFQLTEPSRYDGCGDYAPFSERFIFDIGSTWYNTKTGDFPRLVDDLDLENSYTATTIELNGANAVWGLCTDSTRKIPFTYNNKETTCKPYLQNTKDGENKAGLDCHFDVEFIMDEPSRIGGIRNGKVIVEIPKIKAVEENTFVELEEPIIIDITTDEGDLVPEATPEQIEEVNPSTQTQKTIENGEVITIKENPVGQEISEEELENVITESTLNKETLGLKNLTWIIILSSIIFIFVVVFIILISFGGKR